MTLHLKKIKINIKFILYLYVFLAMFYNSGSFMSTVNSNIGMILNITASMGLILYYRKISKTTIHIAIALCTIFLVNIIATNNYVNITSYIRLYLIIWLAILIIQYIDINDFFYHFVKIMTIVALIAIIIYVVINVIGLTSWLSKLPIIKNVNNVSAYNGGLFIVYNYSYKRSCAFFWEPAVYSTYLVLSIILELYFFHRTSKVRLIILVVGVLTSQSTGGIILLAYVLLFYFVMIAKNQYTKCYMMILLMFFLFLFFLNFDKILDYLIKVYPNIFSKLDSSLQKDTLVDRSNSGLINLTIFKTNPLFGVGLSKVEDLYLLYDGGAQTSTITYFLASFGLLGVIYIGFFTLAIFRQKNIFIIGKIFLFCLIVIILSKEPYGFQTGIYVIFGMLLKNQVSLKSIQRRKI